MGQTDGRTMVVDLEVLARVGMAELRGSVHRGSQVVTAL